MSKLAQLRERRDSTAKEAHSLNAKYPADQRMTADDAKRLDELLGSVEQIDAEITREIKAQQLLTDDPARQQDAVLAAATRDPSKQSDNSKALKAYLKGGLQALSDAQRKEMLGRQPADIRATQTDMNTTTGAEGGYTVSPEYSRTLEAAMAAYSGMMEVATIINTATGSQMNFPTADATDEVGEIVGQNAPAAEGLTAFGNVTLDVYRYSSKKIALPWELLQDSFLDIEAYIQGLLAARLGRIANTHFTVGTGTGQPKGIVAAAGASGVTSSSSTAVTYDELVDLEHSVNRAYRAGPGVGWMFADATLAEVRKIKDDQKRPIFVPGYESGVVGGAPDMLMGRPIIINDDVPVMAASAKSILFGAFRKYIIRRVMDLTVFRMTDSAFTLNGQVGFVAFQRMGGNLVDAGGAVKVFANKAA